MAAKTVPMIDPATCVHRWKLDTPIAELVKGVCTYCKSERQFVSWERDGCQKCGGLVTRNHTCREGGRRGTKRK